MASLILAPEQPAAGRSYPAQLSDPRNGWGRLVTGALLALWLWMALGGLVSQVTLLAAWRIGHHDMDKEAFLTAARGYHFWEGMLASHLSIITMIPIVVTLARFWNGLAPGQLWSVSGRIRGRYLVICLMVAAVVFGGYVALTTAGRPATDFAVQQGFAPFLVLIVLVTPLQATAEELLFRGYLVLCLGGLFPVRPRGGDGSSPALRRLWEWGPRCCGVIGSALLFALFHGAQNPALFCSRFVFGVLAGALVVQTGGLEAGIAAHVMNNVASFLLAGFTGGIAAVRQVTAVSWLQAFSDVIVFAVIAGLCAAVAHWLGVPRRTGSQIPATR